MEITVITQIKDLNALGQSAGTIATNLQLKTPTVRYWLKRMRGQGIPIKRINPPGRKKLNLSPLQTTPQIIQ